MTDETIPAPPEAEDSRLSSNAKDDFFANQPEGAEPPPPVNDVPERPPAQGYEVRFRNSTEEDADFEAAEQNAKEVPEGE